jgi:hypothetical protein
MSQDDIVSDMLPGIYGEVGEIIAEICARMPYGQEIHLSNGRVGRFKKFAPPSIDEETGRWKFGFDIVFDKGSPDHLEFYVKHTGGGGFVGVATTPIAPATKSQ